MKKTDVTTDNVNHPDHYTWLRDKCGIEVIDITVGRVDLRAVQQAPQAGLLNPPVTTGG